MTGAGVGAGQEADLVVIGAGPAGIGAATAAASVGARVIIVDEHPHAGGQVYRAPSGPLRSEGRAKPEAREGARLRAALAASGATHVTAHRVWSISSRLAVDAAGPRGLVRWTPRALVIATGTTERIVPFPGWTQPGIIGLGAATLLLKCQGMLPGRSTVVAGCGPLLAAVAVGILEAGGRVEAVVDLAGARDWLAGTPEMLSRPHLLRQGIAWLARLAGAGVPVYRRHAVVAARQCDAGLAITIRPLDAAGAPLLSTADRVLQADCLAIGHGLVPSTEATRLLRARHRFVPLRGGWIAETDPDFRTSVPGLFVAGDAAGLSGAVPALHQGRIAGFAAAHDLGLVDGGRLATLAAADRRALSKAEGFARAAARLMAPRAALAGTITPDTVVCRCEDVTRAEIEAAISDGAHDLNQLKAWTRCGMGACQGRTCGEAAGMLLAGHVGGREQAGYWTGRAPLRPVPLSDLVGDFSYDDIPIPRAAPQ